jgi:hypothetical protein
VPESRLAIKHKRDDYGLMKSFMTTVSLSRVMEVDEVPIDEAPFPREDAIMMIFGRYPSPEKQRGLNAST